MNSDEEWYLQVDVLFIEHRTQLRRAAFKILGDWDRADDVIHDAYLRIRDCSDNKSEVKQPIAYLFQTVRNMAIDQYRRAVFELDLFDSEEEGLLVPDKLRTPDIYLMHCQSLDLIVAALNELPERTRRIFELYRLEGYTQRMIAEELQISVSLVNILIHAAIHHCKEALSSRS
ncbi:RNA polymerase sigma-70 factor (ECF subfamily) [Nitrosomonas oligotropha]|uniref:RNA polymerase sigma-70 factor (ECF subfamily) n=1 Tax=Nitrosomonas oligotropha TaxID=42354 RepID=A0A2T5I3G2_9PROT|nr:sigma-70 family RNA polymerase sigma factor [Nitrosomonas oligotropha]PTQ78352.1 RNA polymerase sigma-70 factor (ECF subfamily) [Nitrosomonas oligotropha]